MAPSATSRSIPATAWMSPLKRRARAWVSIAGGKPEGYSGPMSGPEGKDGAAVARQGEERKLPGGRDDDAEAKYRHGPAGLVGPIWERRP